MKIAIDTHSLNNEKWAGKEKYVNNLIRELTVIDKENQYYLYLKEDITLKLSCNFKKKIIKFSSILWHFIAVFDLLFLKPDVYLSPTSYIVPALKISTPTIVVIHDLVSFIMPNRHNKKAKILEKIFMKIACKRAKFIITVSENTKKDLINFFNIKSNKIFVIPEAPDYNFRAIEDGVGINKVLTKYNLSNNFILSVGTLEPRKNLVRLIEAYKNLVDMGLSKYKLVIVGKKGWYYEEIFKKAKQLNIEKNIVFLGYVSDSDLNCLYNTAKCFIYPSLYEGFGLPVLEAMMCGCPVVASNNSSLPEVVGKAGILFDPCNTDDIREKLYKILTNDSLIKEMQKKGIEQIKFFSWYFTAIEILKKIESIK